MISVSVNVPFSNTVTIVCNRIPDTIESVNSFKNRLDKYWNDQEVKFNWTSNIKGTGSRSNILKYKYNIK